MYSSCGGCDKEYVVVELRQCRAFVWAESIFDGKLVKPELMGQPGCSGLLVPNFQVNPEGRASRMNQPCRLFQFDIGMATPTVPAHGDDSCGSVIRVRHDKCIVAIVCSGLSIPGCRDF
jgi:hypothetical protein